MMSEGKMKETQWLGLGITLILCLFSTSSLAAVIINNENTDQIITVTEGASKHEMVITVGEQTDFCAGGCFVMLPNGDREVLTGSETIILQDGKATIK